MDELKIINSLHTATKRDYLERVNSVDKAWAAEKASNWGYDYWDGSRQTGYGGYKYDGRWKKVAKQLVEKYQMGDGAKILDVGVWFGIMPWALQQLGYTDVSTTECEAHSQGKRESFEVLWSWMNIQPLEN